MAAEIAVRGPVRRWTVGSVEVEVGVEFEVASTFRGRFTSPRALACFSSSRSSAASSTCSIVAPRIE
jgi:hypothetical protein